MGWRIAFAQTAERELRKIGRTDQARIVAFLERRLALRDNPREIGEALAGEWTGYWKYRVGDWRLIAQINDGEIIIMIVRIGHRGAIYR